MNEEILCLPTERQNVICDDIADYARESMKTFTESKIISGYDKRLHPLGLTTRAQAAQILYNLLK